MYVVTCTYTCIHVLVAIYYMYIYMSACPCCTRVYILHTHMCIFAYTRVYILHIHVCIHVYCVYIAYTRVSLNM